MITTTHQADGVHEQSGDSGVGFDQETEIRASNLVARVETQSFEQLDRTLTGRFDHLGFGLDFEEFSESRNSIEGDGVSITAEPFAGLLDRRGRLESEFHENIGDGIPVIDGRLKFGSGLRFRFYKRSFVRYSGFVPFCGTLTADPEGLVRFGELPNGMIVVGVDLSYRPLGNGIELRQPGPNAVVIGPDFYFDFVHDRWLSVDRQKRRGSWPPRNVIVKGATAVVGSMSDESDEVEETETADEAAAETANGEPNDAETEEPDEETETADGLQDGDFVRVGYTARTVEDSQLVDTTDEEIAEEEGVADQGEFEPRVIVLGEGHLFPDVEDDIRGKEVGDEGSVLVAAEDAFGEYDEEEVSTVSADKIDEDDRYPGARIQIDGQQGVLETIIGGRARVDFNHPLAGEDIEYEYEILGTVEDDLEQARGLLGMFLDLDLEMWVETDEVEETRVEEPDEADDEDAEPETITETVEKRTLYVESTPQLSMNQQCMMQKQQIAGQLIELTDIDRILIQEILDGDMGMGMGGMMGGMGGGAGDVDIEEALEEADIDAEEIAEEIE